MSIMYIVEFFVRQYAYKVGSADECFHVIDSTTMHKTLETLKYERMIVNYCY